MFTRLLHLIFCTDSNKYMQIVVIHKVMKRCNLFDANGSSEYERDRERLRSVRELCRKQATPIHDGIFEKLCQSFNEYGNPNFIHV